MSPVNKVSFVAESLQLCEMENIFVRKQLGVENLNENELLLEGKINAYSN